ETTTSFFRHGRHARKWGRLPACRRRTAKSSSNTRCCASMPGEFRRSSSLFGCPMCREAEIEQAPSEFAQTRQVRRRARERPSHFGILRREQSNYADPSVAEWLGGPRNEN